MPDNRRRSKDNDEYHDVPLDQLPYNEELAVIPWELYRQVNLIRRKRAQPTIAEGRKPSAPYPLQGKLVCSHCMELVREGKLPVEKARLTGQTDSRSSTPVYRYRHDKKTGCGTRCKSQRRHVPEADVLALMHEMSLLSQQREVMHTVVRQLYEAEQPKSAKADRLTREGRIAVLRSQIENKRLFALDEREASYGYHDFKRDEARLLEEIRKLEAQNAEPDEIIVHLDECIDLICDFPRLWEMADDDEQTYLIDMVFEDHGLHYDLEQKRITYYLLVPTMRYLQHICCMIESD
jgi:hypothetical protein